MFGVLPLTPGLETELALFYSSRGPYRARGIVNVVTATSAKEVMFSSLFDVCLPVCLFLSNFAQKLPNGFA